MDALGDAALSNHDDEVAGRAQFLAAAATATQTNQSRLSRAEQAYVAIAHYQRVAQLQISDETRRFLLGEASLIDHLADMLLSDATEAQINETISDFSGKPFRY